MNGKFEALANAIMENYTCLNCFEHYKKNDEVATYPKCKLIRKVQIERYMSVKET